ncbi:MAG TPA: hypothetical protein PKL05_01955 [bacterium]|nr:hypothetical protein [bacterium]
MFFFRYGEDDFQIKRAIRQQLADFNQSAVEGAIHLNAAEIDSSVLFNAIGNQSLFQQTKIIILDNPFSSKNAELLDGLCVLLNNHEQKSTAWLLLINETNLKLKYQAGKNRPVIVDIEGRSRPLTKAQEKLFTLLTADTKQQQYYPRLTGLAAENLLETLIKEHGGQMAPSAKKLLLELTNYNFWQISHELNKLINYQASINPKIVIDDDLVRLLVNDTSRHLFEFIEAFSRQDLSTSAGLLEEIFANEDDLAISVALLNRQALQFLQIKARLAAGQTTTSLEKSLGLPISVSRKLIQQANLIQLVSLQQLVDNLIKFDWSKKRSRGNLAALFTLLLINHANQK